MKIRPDQLEAFATAGLRRFEDQLVPRLRERWPARCADLDEASLRASVRAGAAACGRAKILAEYDVARYLDVMYATTFELEAQPWAQRVMNDADLAADEKIARLCAAAQEQRDEPTKHLEEDPVLRHSDPLSSSLSADGTMAVPYTPRAPEEGSGTAS